MIDRRTVTGCCLICFPALVATAFTVLACLRLRPVYEEQERVRLTGVYREVAEELRDHPEMGTDVKLPPRRGRIRSMGKSRWGYVEEASSVKVWHILDGRAQVKEVPKSATLSFAVLMLLTGSVALTVFWIATIAGCCLFVRSIKERDDFVAATAHDLTTPLVALRRLVGRDDEEAKLVVERLVRLVTNLTDYLKLKGRRRPEVTSFDLREAYDEAYTLFREDFRWLANGQDVEVSGEATLPVRADRLMTVQILWNLLSNALKYGAPYGPVTVRFEADAKEARVLFADEGPGLTPRERKRVFNRYYRAKSVMKSGKGGFGIGLCTAREHARQMGGDLTVRANVPKGCVFTLKVKRGG